jgi:RNA polymerase sigma-70 factor (ECF subfamily)
LRNRLRRQRRDSAVASLNGEVAARSDVEAERDRHELIARALAELPENYEAVLRAKYLEQKSVVEIAADWQQSPKAIESLLTRAREAFRQSYSSEG